MAFLRNKEAHLPRLHATEHRVHDDPKREHVSLVRDHKVVRLPALYATHRAKDVVSTSESRGSRRRLGVAALAVHADVGEVQ
jgi:hypothetical protein